MANNDMADCCECCCRSGINCIITSITLFATFILNLIVLVCLASLLVWMMLCSSAVKFQVHDAELTRFDLDDSNNNNLHYNLSLNFSIRNSNKYMGIHYDRYEATVYYIDQRIASVSVPSFYQGHKSTTDLKTVFEGQNLVLFGEQGRGRFEDDRKLGVYGIDVKIMIKSRVLFAHLVTWPMKPIVRCHLKVPLSSYNSSKGFDFQSTNCNMRF